jgi:UDPglucose--hexose-1-phosphate uridylyltransferase
MSSDDVLHASPHRRFNPLRGEWVLVSPQRLDRPWLGRVDHPASDARPAYDADCYLCPGNLRAGGDSNPPYERTYVFTGCSPLEATRFPARAGPSATAVEESGLLLSGLSRLSKL